MKKSEYTDELTRLQIQLVALQRDVIEHGRKVAIVFEGRDAAGKDGTIKRIIEHLSPRDLRVVALGKPSDRDKASWYFQRYVAHLPAEGEIVLFNRSWYNRAGVEHVMGFCTPAEYHAFMSDVGAFEKLLADAGIHLLKYYLDISRDEQAARLAERAESPLTQWKISPIDAVALERFVDYSEARNAMLANTSNPVPWRVIPANSKRRTRLTVIRDMLNEIPCPELSGQTPAPSPGDRYLWAQGNQDFSVLAG
ncbi:polyphosphate kinase 2 [Hyphobacterium sp. SN044]|uniref:polyphosphate kinase 2 n=1 Tax=Hyphobacterium sp. SN044 TaxID=2912575 RepID=UPI001F010B9B|nr:polyphosphate kinase 2 [Hyphobacterium sp. SN044]MCF8879047.1 polyphosphate kinase 2 [Hyphobacterium sp. SN044]